MAQKRKAQTAFGKPQGQLSAFAAAKLARNPTPSTKQPNSELDESHLVDAITTAPYDGHHSGTTTPHAGPEELTTPVAPARRWPPAQLSSFRTSSANVIKDDEETLEFSLQTGEYTTLIGEYDIAIVAGLATIYGSVLQPKTGPQRVYVPSTHALPRIEARQDNTHIRISCLKSRLRKLESLSPLFRNIWSSSDSEDRSFRLLTNTNDDTLQRPLYPLEIDKEFEKAMKDLSYKATQPRSIPSIMAVGAKSSGKSTLNRMLCNYIHSWADNTKIFYLDLDPGQPELGPPGQLSLIEVTAPVLGPPFTHPASAQSTHYRLIRSHTIAATTFKDDPDLYLACAKDLVVYAERQYPLVVNSCGWVSGLGATVLAELVGSLNISDIVLLEPLDTALVESLEAQSASLSFHRIPRRHVKPSSRTPAENRAMQIMAYFHQRPSPVNGPSRWSRKSTSRSRPWIVSYAVNAGADQDIFAICSYGQSPRPEFLAEVLDGSIVAIVVLEEESKSESTQDVGQDANQYVLSTSEILGNVARTPSEHLPYLPPDSEGLSLPIDPKKSHCIGLALVRGTDAENKTLQLVSPLPEAALEDQVRGKKVVLVRGAFDPPEWAYLEDLYKNEFMGGSRERPWVTSKERTGVEGAVWRLRHPPMPGNANLQR